MIFTRTAVALANLDLSSNPSFNSREMFAQFATGVCILLVEDNNRLIKGLTINSFSSLSLDPLLITFSLKSKSRFFLDFNKNNDFSINVLSVKQQALARRCSVAGGAIFLLSEILQDKVCYIPDCLVSICCHVKEIIEGGDHVIFVCKVLNMLRNKNDTPLLFFNSQYCSMSL